MASQPTQTQAPRSLACDLNWDLPAEEIILFVIFKFPFHHQFYRGVFILHRKLIQVAVDLVFLDGAVDSTLTTVRLRNREGDPDPFQDAVDQGRAVLGLSAAGKGDVDTVGLAFVQLTGIGGTWAHIHLLYNSHLRAAVLEVQGLRLAGSDQRQQQDRGGQKTHRGYESSAMRGGVWGEGLAVQKKVSPDLGTRCP